MPSSARESFFVLRALNVEIAGARDAARGNVLATRVRLQFFRDLIGAAFVGGTHAHPLYQPLASAVRRHGLTRRWLERLVDARAAALDAPPPTSVADLEAYADQTASSLLFLSLESCGVRDDRADEAASLIGRAAGISTVLRALPARLATRAAAAAGLERTTPGYLPEHHGLPSEELGRAGLSDQDLAGLGLRLLADQRPDADAQGRSSAEGGDDALCSVHAAERGVGQSAEVRSAVPMLGFAILRDFPGSSLCAGTPEGCHSGSRRAHSDFQCRWCTATCPKEQLERAPNGRLPCCSCGCWC